MTRRIMKYWQFAAFYVFIENSCYDYNIIIVMIDIKLPLNWVDTGGHVIQSHNRFSKSLSIGIVQFDVYTTMSDHQRNRPLNPFLVRVWLVLYFHHYYSFGWKLLCTPGEYDFIVTNTMKQIFVVIQFSRIALCLN